MRIIPLALSPRFREAREILASKDATESLKSFARLFLDPSVAQPFANPGKATPRGAA